MAINKETADRAAKWWAYHLRNGAPLDNGDPSPEGGMAMMLGLLAQKQFSTEKIDNFEKELSLLIQERDEYVNIGVDYHPDYTLSKAAENSDIELGMSDLPWKTGMWIRDDEIKVSLGYRGESVVI